MTATPYALKLTDAAAAIREGALTSEALTRSLLDRIDATDVAIDAWAFLDTDRALAKARAIDVLRSEGRNLGALAGIGIGVKDIIATADLPTQMGSPIYAGVRAAFAAECVMRLERAGAFVLGKTVTTEFAFLHPGKTRNPWRSSHTPGGSSSGSAAAVAIGHVPAALGTQTNGSVIRPAAYCGVVGFKPTKDALPFAGVNLFSPTLDTLGMFARSVADCALLAASLAEPQVSVASGPVLSRPPTLAVMTQFPWVQTSTEQAAALDAVVGTLRGAGASVTAVELPHAMHDANVVHRKIMLREGADQLGALQVAERARMSDVLNAALDEGRAIGDEPYRAALTQRTAMIVTASDWLSGFDAVVSPPVPGPAPAGLTRTGDPSCCTLWSLLGFPAITLPVALNPQGLPMGMQLAASAGADDRLLAVAQWCEQRLAFKGLT